MKQWLFKANLLLAALAAVVICDARQPAAAQTPDLFLSSLFGPDGTVDTSRVLRYDAATGTPIDVFASGGVLRGPAGLAIGPDGHLYVCSVFDHSGQPFEGSILRYNGTTGAFMDTFVPYGRGGMNRPQNLAFGPDGNLYVCSVDNGHDAILKFNGKTGRFIRTFVRSGSGGLVSPLDLIFAPDGNLYVSNHPNSVLRYNGKTGKFIDAFVPSGSGGLSAPRGLTFGPDGNLYISSAFTDSVLRYHGTTGAFVDAFVPSGSGGLDFPGYGLAFGPDGNLYVAQFTDNGRVLRYDGATGAFLDVFIPPGSGGLTAPSDLLFRGVGVFSVL